MFDRRAEILKQLERGEITADQALVMLNQQPPPEANRMNDFRAADGGYSNEQSSGPGNHRDDRSRSSADFQSTWVDDLVNWVGNVVHDVTDEVSDWDFNISDFLESGYKRQEVFTSSPVSQGIASLTLPGKNARVEIKGYDGNVVHVECKIHARYPDTEIYLHEENGHLELIYDKKQMRSVAICCLVPHVLVKELHVDNKNSKIVVSGVRLGNMQLRTTNSSISIESVQANTALLQTTNARIKAENIDTTHLKMATTNSGLKFKENLLAENCCSGERIIEAHTTNSGVSFYIPSDAGLQINARTSNGRFVIDRDDMYFVESSKTHISGKSNDYDFSANKLKLELGTTNASVKVRSA